MVPDPIDFCIAQDMVAIRADKEKIDPRYLFAVLRSQEVQKRIDNMHVGTRIPHFKKGDFDKLFLPVPERKVQELIGEIYFTLSYKIELNQQMNRTLEGIARALFKSWFIDFDPVRAKLDGRQPYGMDAETAATFPDSFEDSPLGKIPKGWKVASLVSVTNYLQRGIQPKYLEEGGVLVINQKCIRDHRLSLDKARRHDPKKRSVEGREIKLGDILVNSIGVGTLGRVAQVMHLPETAVVDSHVTIVRPNPSLITIHYLGYALIEREYEIEDLGEGSTGQTELSRLILGNIDVLVPDPTIQHNFDQAVALLRQQIVTNELQNLLLASIRDALLPKLLSGEIRLKNAEQALKALIV